MNFNQFEFALFGRQSISSHREMLIVWFGLVCFMKARLSHAPFKASSYLLIMMRINAMNEMKQIFITAELKQLNVIGEFSKN